MSFFRSLSSAHTDALRQYGDSICLSASESGHGRAVTAFNATVNANAPPLHRQLRKRRLAEWWWRLAARGGGGGGVITGLH